jgi:anti-anti-sigma factor
LNENTLPEDSELEVRSEVADGVAVCRISGRFDAEAATSQGLRSAVDSAINGGASRIIFDMREVTFITSAGLRVVLMTAKQATAAKGGLSIFGVQSAVDEVFEISGLKKFIPITSDEADARAKLGA